MKDFKIDNNTQQFIIENNDLVEISGDDELVQNVWALLTTKLNTTNLFANNTEMNTTILGRNIDNINLQSIIATILSENDSRIVGVDINSQEFDRNKRTLKLDISVLTSDGRKVNTGGALNAWWKRI